MDPAKQPSDDQPVAYDTNGQPLYSHPHPTAAPAVANDLNQTNQTAKPPETRKPISDVNKLKHERSCQLFPNLNLTDGEYIISAVKRHPIGLFVPMLIGFLLVLVGAVVLVNYVPIAESLQIDESNSLLAIGLPMVLFIVLVLIGTYVTYSIYTNNKFFLTNESVIQEIQTGIFSKHEQTVNLSNIEDASYTQNGIIQQMFDYGSIRLSTEGDETTYRFSYVAGPKQHIATLTNAIEAFKSGRPIEITD